MEIKKQLEKLLNSKSKYLIVLALVGVILILISTTTKKRENTKKEDAKKTYKTMDTKEYEQQLENKLKDIISKIKGVGKSDVFITLENGVENIYANSEKKIINSNENFSGKMSKKNDLQRDVVIIDGNKGKKALMVTQKEPTIKGVLVVCEGGDNVQVVEQITDAISKSLNIKKNRLSVVKGS